MNEQHTDVESWEVDERTQSRRIEPDWTESDWFQVWLELARRPHARLDSELAVERP